MLESVYEEALAHHLLSDPFWLKLTESLGNVRDISNLRQLFMLQSKAVSKFIEVFESQALTDLRLTDLKLALAINFGEKYVKNGIHRVVNGL